MEKEYPNETLRMLCERASCREFSTREVPSDVMYRILEAGIHAPTGGNLQPYSIIKVEQQKTRERLAELCAGQHWISEAPVDLLFCIDWHRIERWAQLEIAPFTASSSFRHFWISFQDTIICAQTICTAAESLGLGSVYIGTVLECLEELRDMFGLPNGVFPVVLLCLGYPEMKPTSRRKLPVDVIVHDETYRRLDERDLKAAYHKKYPNLKVEITEERLQRIAEVCRRVHGEEFGRRCMDRIHENGYINAAQRYFGLHYPADLMPQGNDRYLELMEEFGFNWFKKHEGVSEDG